MKITDLIQSLNELDTSGRGPSQADYLRRFQAQQGVPQDDEFPDLGPTDDEPAQAPSQSNALGNMASQLTRSNNRPAGQSTPTSTGGTTTTSATGVRHTASQTNPNQPRPAAQIAATSGPSQNAAPKPSTMDRIKSIGKGVKDVAVGTVKGAGDIASQAVGGIGQTLGAAVGGAKAGYHTARQGKTFTMPGGGGYRPQPTVQDFGASGGSSPDEVDQLRQTIANMDARMRRAGFESKKV